MQNTYLTDIDTLKRNFPIGSLFVDVVDPDDIKFILLIGCYLGTVPIDQGGFSSWKIVLLINNQIYIREWWNLSSSSIQRLEPRAL